MKRNNILFILILFFVGCQLDEIEQPDRECAKPMIFNAGIEKSCDAPETKTLLGGSASDTFRNVLWEKDDEVCITNGFSLSKFINSKEDSLGVALLTGKLAESANYYAAYPFHIVNNYSSQGFEINLLPTQTYQKDGVASGVFPMVAQFDDGMFHFKNLCGILVLKLVGRQTVSSITFRGREKSGDYLKVAGRGLVSMAYSDFPELDLSMSSQTSVVLDCPGGVRLNTSKPTLFHIVLPPMTYDSFEVEVKQVDGQAMVITSENPLTIKRSTRSIASELGWIIDLSKYETANSYIVSNEGAYKFKAVQGNSETSVGAVASADVLWESFGTEVTPAVGDLIKNVSYADGYVTFETADTFKEGNAVIAAKDASGEILWSWHIWLTDAPKGQEYYNNAGTMMDRNLGATSATPGDVGALGLLYQWGRKDPFLGSSSISSNTVAKSTITWPSVIKSNSSNGTIEYATKNPTTFITYNSNNDDWYYTGSSSTDNTRWTTSDKTKSIYDPCPPGWRVPDGGSKGVWSKALGLSSSFGYTYNSTNEGMLFYKFGSASTIWYPASGYLTDYKGGLGSVGDGGDYWSASPYGYNTYGLYFDYNGNVFPSDGSHGRADGQSVRCIREGTGGASVEVVAKDLSYSESANTYIVENAGAYKFKTVQGNSSTSVGEVSFVDVLWESFGTDVIPSVGDLIKNVSYQSGYITFETADTFKEGNAVIAAKDASGNILWSWHIWLTDEPQGQVYYNNAGTMMDRNLGATSATPGDVGALGLLYQWGRKDPFLGSSSISSDVLAKSTITWPSTVRSTSYPGTIAYATKNPTTFITNNSNNYDWYYTGSSSTDNTRWTTSDTPKSIYDPCPPGWRVPDGGSDGVWSKVVGSSSDFYYTYNSSNEGMNFSGKFGSASTIWYPASGYRSNDNGVLNIVGDRGYYWSASPNGSSAYSLYLSNGGFVYPSSNYSRALGLSVRCIQEGTWGPSEILNAVDLSSTESANSYIVSEAGAYKFKAVQGNNETPVGSVATSEVLWETFGTDVTPEVGNLVKYVSCEDGYIAFQTAETFKEGNAVIAAKDASGNILWSWHIWMTDEPQGQEYYNNAGTMMDRNLGATSATPGDVGALGLLYQWGRKDPFLASSSISSSTVAKSTITWPSTVNSTSSTGTIAYATKNPTTFISGSSSTNYDWYYSSRDNTLWTTSDKTKSIYDPCPPGWRVSDGGSNGVWSKAVGSSSYFDYTYNSYNEGMNFSGKFGSASTIWYPASGYREGGDGSLNYVGYYGYYWSASPYSNRAYYMYFSNDGFVHPSNSSNRADGQSVRCVQEGSWESSEILNAVDLSSTESANSYVISEAGAYKFKAVQGNSKTSVGTVASASVLWETFGTDAIPSVGDLIKNVSYKDGYITFETASAFKEGNAVIAAKDASGNILWSWHIWLTDKPQEQVYYNNAGTMMDRNLGATSATPGDVGALGLLYQWGRKDPFLGSSSILEDIEAKSTITWPSAVESNSSNGTIEYATKNPTTFITFNDSNWDWYYTGSSSTDDTRWTTSDKAKSIYDPCPPGWRVPDGGSSGVWSKASGSSSYFNYTYNDTNEGMNFSGKFGSASTIWYPASGNRCYSSGGGVSLVGYYGDYWSASPGSRDAYHLNFRRYGNVELSDDVRAYGKSVRCVLEGSWGPSIEIEKVDLSSESANSYVIREAGAYKFKTVKGNSKTSVGTVAFATVLWETFGTDVTPEVGDLVKYVSCEDGYIAFQTADTFKEGNAVIAAKDASGNILWSWHIWLTDAPQGQEYYNNAGTMMDRNLGATSATPGDVGALGLLYQWGRKDPFLGSSSISSNTLAESTINWPSSVSSNSSNGTIEYATKNPTTFITKNDNNYDWYYTGSSSTDNTRWTTSDKAKSIYDPCPPGWRVPDGGGNGVWLKAAGSSSSFDYTYNGSKKGMNFSGKFGSASTIWYPASGCRDDDGGSLLFCRLYGYYWSASPYGLDAFHLDLDSNGTVNPSYDRGRAYGRSVRCLLEGSWGPSIEISTESANSYVISEAGAYKFRAVQGNSETSVGAVASASVLWETFGTDVTPAVGDLIKNVSYSDGYISFLTAATFKEGNAVIAAKDASGNILWSWHIWLTDAPKGQVYYNNAGTMMDRNLGATSATPGDVGALGLLYQWGRKDPFLGSSSISSNTLAKSTFTWPSAVSSTSSAGTIAYATKNPTTFIKYNSSNYDWYYTGSSSTDNTRWTTSDKAKSIYDPCPAGWRVPDGGSNGVWSKAVGSSSFSYTYNSSNEGMNFSGKFGSASTIWYPASGHRDSSDGSLSKVGLYGNYLSASPYSYHASYLLFNYGGHVGPASGYARAGGLSVRCLRE